MWCGTRLVVMAFTVPTASKVDDELSKNLSSALDVVSDVQLINMFCRYPVMPSNAVGRYMM